MQETGLPDYSAWLTPDRLKAEDEAWLRDHTEERMGFGNDVLHVCRRFGLHRVLELGCGTGWLANLLPDDIQYIGIDDNNGCLALAHQRLLRHAVFYGMDIREIGTENFLLEAHLVCCFSVLKHFSLEEFPSILGKMLSCAPFAVFSMQDVDGPSIDDGVEYHHLWVNITTLIKAVRDGGHQFIQSPRVTWNEGDKYERVFFTARRPNRDVGAEGVIRDL